MTFRFQETREMVEMISTAIVGGSGYVGGDLARLVLGHPELELVQVTSESQARRYVHTLHPNLRGLTRMKYSQLDQLEEVDLLLLALPHGEAARRMDHFADLAQQVIDLSADLRLRSPETYLQWYGQNHPAPQWLSRFVYGLPELHRHQLTDARYVSGVGCNATAVNLALLPLARAGLLERVVVDLKVGSSEGGATPSRASHHAERSGAVRSFAPVGHRHQAEVHQALGTFELHFSVTSIEMVRGVLCTAHVLLNEPLEEQEAWRLYREAYGSEPFVRLIREKQGLYRYPEPKLLAGTNHCDISLVKDPASDRLVVLSALDNLMKGAAGTALQCANLMNGLDETAGLTFPGLHPI